MDSTWFLLEKSCLPSEYFWCFWNILQFILTIFNKDLRQQIDSVITVCLLVIYWLLCINSFHVLGMPYVISCIDTFFFNSNMNSVQFNVCRAVRASSSFSFLEVIVSCEVTGRDQNPENLSCNADDKVGKTFYLHLKRFFRGARFTWQPFLNSIQEKRNIDLVTLLSLPGGLVLCFP